MHDGNALYISCLSQPRPDDTQTQRERRVYRIKNERKVEGEEIVREREPKDEKTERETED